MTNGFLCSIFHSAPSVSSPSSEMTERTANIAVPNSFVQSFTADSFCRLMPQLGKRVHTKWGNGYYVVKL